MLSAIFGNNMVERLRTTIKAHDRAGATLPNQVVHPGPLSFIAKAQTNNDLCTCHVQSFLEYYFLTTKTTKNTKGIIPSFILRGLRGAIESSNGNELRTIQSKGVQQLALMHPDWHRDTLVFATKN
jgi:hypothetical protein